MPAFMSATEPSNVSFEIGSADFINTLSLFEPENENLYRAFVEKTATNRIKCVALRYHSIHLNGTF